MARTVIHGTERLIKTALNEVDSTLKTDGGFVFNNVPVYLHMFFFVPLASTLILL